MPCAQASLPKKGHPIRKQSVEQYLCYVSKIFVYLEASTRTEVVEELAMILPPWSTKMERVGSRQMWF